MNDLSQFRPLSAEQKYRVRGALRDTKLMLCYENAKRPEDQNKAYNLYLTNHIRMLEKELEIAGGS